MDYPITLTSPNRLVQIDKVIFFMPIIYRFFLLKYPLKKHELVHESTKP
jgi:hypothetical protein